jgi:hypothetical protein
MGERQGWVARVTGGHPSDPLPSGLLLVTLIGSVAAIGLGAWMDRVNLGLGFLLNILANLALLGPGLWATNRIVRNARLRPHRADAEAAVESLRALLRRLLRDCAALQPPVDELMRQEPGCTVVAQLRELGTSASRTEDLLREKVGQDRGFAVPYRASELLTATASVEPIRKAVGPLVGVLDLRDVGDKVRDLAADAQTWDEFRTAQSGGVSPLIAGEKLARSLGCVAAGLAAGLPRVIGKWKPPV